MLPTYKMSIYFLYCLDIDIPIQKTAYYSMTTRYMETNKKKQSENRLLGAKAKVVGSDCWVFYLDQCFTNPVCICQADNRFPLK